MSEHTPEPWRIGDSKEPIWAWRGQILGKHEDGTDFILGSMNQNYEERAIADARRIVACINACRGIETPELENGTLFKPRLARIKADMLAQSDELAAVLRERDEARVIVAELAAVYESLDERVFTVGQRHVIAKAKAIHA